MKIKYGSIEEVSEIVRRIQSGEIPNDEQMEIDCRRAIGKALLVGMLFLCEGKRRGMLVCSQFAEQCSRTLRVLQNVKTAKAMNRMADVLSDDAKIRRIEQIYELPGSSSSDSESVQN